MFGLVCKTFRMLLNVCSKRICLSLSVISLATLTVHPVGACTLGFDAPTAFVFETDAADTTAPSVPLLRVGGSSRGEAGGACSTDCGSFGFVELLVDESNQTEEVGYVVEFVGDETRRLTNLLDGPANLDTGGTLLVQWSYAGSVSWTLSISAVDRAGNVSEPVEVRLVL